MKLLLDLQVLRILKQFSKVGLKWKGLVCLEIPIRIILELRQARGRVRSGPGGFVMERTEWFFHGRAQNSQLDTWGSTWRLEKCHFSVLTLFRNKMIGFAQQCWNGGQATSRVKLVECHQHRSKSTAFTGHVNLPGHLCTYCTDTSVSAVFWEEWQSHCSLDACRSPGESTNLLPFFIANAVSKEVPASFSFHCWESTCHCWCWGVLSL